MSEQLNRELAAVEATLSSLSPAEAHLDRDQLMYTAGAQAAKCRARQLHRYWLASAAALLSVSVGLAGLLMTRTEPRVVERIICRDRETNNNLAGSIQEVDAPDASSADDRRNRFRPTDAPGQYMRLRRLVLTEGLAGLPESFAGPDSETPRSPTDPGSRKMLKKLLGT